MASPALGQWTNSPGDQEKRATSLPHSPSGISSSSSAMGNGRDNEYIPLNVSEEPQDRSRRTGGINRRALVTFLGIVVAVVAIITVTVIFVVYSDSSGGKEDKASKVRPRDESRYTFEDIFNGKFSPVLADDKWYSDDILLSIEDGGIVEREFSTNKESELFSKEKLDALKTTTDYFSLSPDRSWMLFTSESTKKYRYSTVSKYFAVNMNSGVSVEIAGPEDKSASPIQYISWGGRGNSLVFVSKNDIYWKKNVDDRDTTRITSTGKDKIVFNGIPDWVYEEEILGTRPSVIISPDGRHLCYASFNDTEVPLYKISMYGKTEVAYTTIQDIAYPKPGFPNPSVHIYIYNVEKNTKMEIKPPKDLQKSDFYFTNLVWSNSSTVSVTWLNRIQDTSVVLLCSVNDGSCIENYRLVIDNGWVSQDYLDPVFSEDGSYYIQVLPKKEGKNGDFLHVAKVPSTENANSNIEFLTHGTWEVKRILAFDEKNGLIYYESPEVHPTQLHTYSVDLNGKKTCLTCTMNETKDGSCHYYSSSFSTKGSRYILTCKGPSAPISWLRSTQNDRVKVLDSNKGLRNLLSASSMPTYKYSKIKSTDGKYSLEMREMRPPDFDEKKKYAVLFSVYGGPSSQEIYEVFQPGFHMYLVSNFDVIVCNVDGRGTESRGRNFEYSVYKQLGVFERDDTLAAARYMQSRNYVDPKRIAVWGWSYGGFLSSFILATQDERIFQSGIAVAPVTDWRYYDSIYTERYMGQPDKSDNFLGYQSSSVLEHAKDIPDDSFLLIHGTGDDNVHFQNSAELVRKLTEAGVQFDMQIYTDKHHSLEGPNIQRHLYHRLTNFFVEKLRL